MSRRAKGVKGNPFAIYPPSLGSYGGQATNELWLVWRVKSFHGCCLRMSGGLTRNSTVRIFCTATVTLTDFAL